MVKKEMSSHHNYTETFWEIAFWCVTSSHRVTPVFVGTLSKGCFRGFREVIFQMALKNRRRKEISSKKKWHHVFWETALWYVNSFQSVISPFLGGVSKHSFWGISDVMSWISWNRMVNKELSSEKPAEKPSQKLLCCGWIQPTDVHHWFHWEAC